MNQFLKIGRITIALVILLIFIHEAEAQSGKKPGGNLLYEIIESDGVEVAVERFRELKENGSQQYDLSETELNKLGYRLLNDANVEAAVTIFKLNTEIHPKSINVWDSLGEAYLALGERNRAIRQYQKVLQMLESDTTLVPPGQNFFRNRAKAQIFIAEHFDAPSESDLHYVSFFGGPRAGKWDMQNLANYKNDQGIKISYQANNLYRSPVPNVAGTFSGTHSAHVSHSFIGGDYRRYIEREAIADISELWNENGWNEVFPAPFRRMATYKGKQYFVPMAYQWNPVWYRKDIFEKHKLTPPETWQELLNLCDRLNELDYTPFAISVQQWPPPVARWFTILNLRLNGPEFHEQVVQRKVNFTDEKIRNVFAHWRELFNHKAFADSSYKNNYAAGIKEFTAGNAVMYNLGEWIFEGLDPKHGSKLDFFVFPEINPEVPSAEIVHTYGAFITADNSDPESSEELLKWLASSESQQSNAKANSRIVANMQVDQTLYSDVQKRIIKQVNDTEVLVPLFEFNTHPDFAQKTLAIFQQYWKEPENIDQTLQKLEEARKHVFSRTKLEKSACMENSNRRQFDFWIGEWDVYVKGEKVAESHIQRTLGGCMILENYRNLKNGFAGKSMNFYDVKLEKWVQVWTDTEGNVSRYTGELRDGKMYFSGTNISRDNKETKVRMEFTPKTDGSVRQIYEQSTDDGESWSTVFDGIYRSKKRQM